MSAVLEAPRIGSDTSAHDDGAPADHLCLHGIGWDAFGLILEGLEGQRLRVSYDRGRLELMVLGPVHERGKSMLRRIVDILTEELSLDVDSLGSMTCRRRDLAKGIEPDECWYIRHATQMRRKKSFDFEVDPPPDLALEMEVSRTVLDRLSIYEALRVPEIWRSDGASVRFLILGEDGRYQESAESRTFVGLRSADLVPFLALCEDEGEQPMVRAFRAWVRQQFCG